MKMDQVHPHCQLLYQNSTNYCSRTCYVLPSSSLKLKSTFVPLTKDKIEATFPILFLEK